MTKPVARPHLKTGPSRKAPPTGAAEKIAALAADGFSKRGVAAGLGTSFDTFQRWLEEDPALKEAFEVGRENERHALHNMLYRQAMEKDNATAAMFLLKARHGYREGDPVETGSRLNITFTLPAALPLADFEVIHDARSGDRTESLPATRSAAARRA